MQAGRSPDFLGIGDAFRHAVRRFVENHGALFDTQMLEHAAALAAALREEAYEEEFLVGESAAASATSMALGPGMGTTGILCRTQSVTKR